MGQRVFGRARRVAICALMVGALMPLGAARADAATTKQRDWQRQWSVRAASRWQATPGQAAAALPSTVSGTDPTGDTTEDDGTPHQDGRADITSFAMQWRTDDNIGAAMSIATGTNPSTWQGVTGVGWAMDTTGDNAVDYIAVWVPGFVGVIDQFGNPICGGRSFWDGGSGYAVLFSAACIGRPASIRFDASSAWDTNPNDENAPVVEDIAPDNPPAGPIG